MESILLLDSLKETLNVTKSQYLNLSINNHINLRLTKDNASSHLLGIVNFPLENINIISYEFSSDQFGYKCFIFPAIKMLNLSYDQNNHMLQLSRINDTDEQTIMNYHNTNAKNFINIPSHQFNDVNYHEEYKAYKFIKSGMDFGTLSKHIINEFSTDSSIIYVDSQTCSIQDLQNTYFTFTNINFKSKESIRKGYEMEDFNNTSWYLKKLFNDTRDNCNLLIQLKIQFLIFINTLNASVCENMHNIIQLFVKCKDEIVLLNALESMYPSNEEHSCLDNFYLLLMTIWEFMNWEMKLYFVKTTLWNDVINKLDTDLINMRITDDDEHIKYFNFMCEKIKRQLKDIIKEKETGYLSDVKNLLYNVDTKGITNEDNLSDDSEMDLLACENNEDQYIEIYGSSEDEYAPAVAYQITYKKY
ncbi:hypothetical protein ACO0R3_001884 [Hanseniaspora guilliermondii]